MQITGKIFLIYYIYIIINVIYIYTKRDSIIGIFFFFLISFILREWKNKKRKCHVRIIGVFGYPTNSNGNGKGKFHVNVNHPIILANESAKEHRICYKFHHSNPL